jgi:hypothetical protein
MQTQDVRNIQLSVLFSPVEDVHQNEMSRHVSRSTITQMELNLRPVRGRLTMKSILMSSHFQAGIFRGCSNLASLI